MVDIWNGEMLKIKNNDVSEQMNIVNESENNYVWNNNKKIDYQYLLDVIREKDILLEQKDKIISQLEIIINSRLND